LDSQGFEVLTAGVVTVGAHLAPEVHAVRGEEQQPQPGLDSECDEAEGDLDSEDDEEPPLILRQPLGVDVAQAAAPQIVRHVGAAAGQHGGSGPGLGAFAEQKHAAGDAIGDRPDHQRPAQRRSDRGESPL
jgi:hypothetical protein